MSGGVSWSSDLTPAGSPVISSASELRWTAHSNLIHLYSMRCLQIAGKLRFIVLRLIVYFYQSIYGPYFKLLTMKEIIDQAT